MTERPSPRVALVTCREFPALCGEEGGVLPLLRERGVEASALVWDDPSVDWSSFDAVFLRSVWDYFRRADEFRSWLDRIDGRARLWNPLAIVRWNLDKRYLRDLSGRGVAIVPTAFLDRGDAPSLEATLLAHGWPEAVVKPSVSGGAYRTFRVNTATAASSQAAFDEILRDSGALVQPFIPEVQSEGEWSLLYFDGALSHAVLKRPASGDYRVQPEFGGAVHAVDPPAWMRAEAERVLAALPLQPAYARLDGVRRAGSWMLMEAELIEPYLFTAYAPGALERYVTLVERAARG